MKTTNVPTQVEFEVAWADPDVDAISFEEDATVMAQGDPANPELIVVTRGLARLRVFGAKADVTVHAFGQSSVEAVGAPNVQLSLYEESSGRVDGVLSVYASGNAVLYAEKADRVDVREYADADVLDVPNVTARGQSTVELLGGSSSSAVASDSASVYVHESSESRIRLYGRAFAELGSSADGVTLLSYDESKSAVQAGTVYATNDATVTVLGGSPVVWGSGRARILLGGAAQEADIRASGQSFVSKIVSSNVPFESIEEWADTVGADYRRGTRILWGYVAADPTTDRAVTNSEVDMAKPQPFLELNEDTGQVAVFAHAVDAARDLNKEIHRVAVPAVAVEGLRPDHVLASDFFVQGKVEL